MRGRGFRSETLDGKGISEAGRKSSPCSLWAFCSPKKHLQGTLGIVYLVFWTRQTGCCRNTKAPVPAAL